MAAYDKPKPSPHARAAALRFWDEWGWDKEWNTPSVDDLARVIDEVINESV